MLEFDFDEYHLTIQGKPSYSTVTNKFVHDYKKEYVIGSGCSREFANSHHGIRVYREKREIASTILLACGWPTDVRENSALIFNNSCIVSISQYVISLSLPNLNLQWFTEIDFSTCFGVYRSDKHNCLISHGEVEIARLSTDGKIIWKHSGADIFTNGFQLFEDHVEVIDFYDSKYHFDIETGRNKIVAT